MYKNNYFTESANTVLKLDKNSKWGYNKKKRTIFDDDEVANSALDYLYADANKSKTQGFLKSNGFPSAGDRRVNRQLYGAAEEQKQVRDLLKNKANNILNPGLNENDRAFLHGLMGDEEGERDYQQRISDANRAQSDLINTFRGTGFEGPLKLSVPNRGVSPQVRYITDDKPDTADEIKHVAVLNSTQKGNIAQYADNKKSPSGLQNSDYSDKGLWHVQETFGPVKEIKPSEPAPKAVRANVEKAGGSVKWDSETNKATIRINGYTEDFYAGDGYGTFIQNGVMYTDKLHLDNLIYAPTQTQVKNIYDEITDDFGKFVLRTWLYGDGSEVKVSGERWNNFIKNNPKVQKAFKETVQKAISAGYPIFVDTKHVALSEDGVGGYTSGYELINGSNRDVGDFALQGNISPIDNGKYLVTIAYTFNDIIDPNKVYFYDWYYSAAADFFHVTGKDYTLRISGTATFTYSDKEGIVYE